jgi:uncharacterized protein (TIGR02466 family)
MLTGLLHATPLVKFDGSEFLEYGNSLFDGSVKMGGSTPNYRTSLSVYDGSASHVRDSEPFEAFIVECAKQFCTELGYATELYDIDVYSIWINEMVANSTHQPHNHYGANFSGTFYVKLPPNAGGISFQSALARVDKGYLEIKEQTIYNALHWGTSPQEGDLLMWESYLIHTVPLTEFEGIRRSIAFDVKLTIKKDKVNNG